MASFDKGNAKFGGDEFDDIGFAHTGRPSISTLLLMPRKDSDVFLIRLLVFDAVEMGTYFEWPESARRVLFDDVLVQIGDQFFGFKSK
ncbi:MAG: hypothetical protein R2860_16980 [Desulfobacterales bacterium]